MTKIGRKLKAGMIAAAMITGGTAVTASGSAPAAATIRYGALFQNANSGKCLEMPFSTTANFATAGQYSCYGGPTQQWNYNTATGLIQNVNSGKCLEDQYYSTANFAPIGQYDCYGGINQQWDLNPSTGLIANRYSHKCLEVLNYNTANFAAIDQYDCYGGATQIWRWS